MNWTQLSSAYSRESGARHGSPKASGTVLIKFISCLVCAHIHIVVFSRFLMAEKKGVYQHGIYDAAYAIQSSTKQQINSVGSGGSCPDRSFWL